MGIPATVQQLIDAIIAENPMHQKFIQSSLANITGEELEHLSKYLDFCIGKGLDLPYIAACYLTIVEDTLHEQMYFMKHKQYRHSSYKDVASDVYNNEEYMNRYMYGLAITSFLWPNHLGMARFFKETLPTDKAGKYLEIGPGHGYYIITAMQNGNFDDFLGIDISKTSIKQTKSLIDHFAPDLKDRYRLDLKDFLAADDLEPGSFDAIVMGEVLEHVETPDIFLRRIAELAAPGAYIFITTCINAPAVDHIYLWRTTDDLETMIESCNLKIKRPLRLPYEGKTLEESKTEDLAINVAYVLEAV